ncbi:MULTISPECIES: hypothetical protein [unclassified Micromonospora]|uniref:hypothetical protein n=1 Tax=unclassified Micromonospora TaxID=2617518 RepID=UPI001C5EDDE0|nr:hypothetical protein [Micromonospora sp. RL09-050-HVF-A]MBW4702262.1 hypothetical protein [Micromonospora sp. RL09-050-HVF-A]
MASRWSFAVLVVLAASLVACDPAPTSTGEQPPVRPAWQPLTLPPPPGPPGRVLLRDATACAGRWYAVGGVADADGGTRPAAWASLDGTTWAVVPIVAESFYGRQNVLSAAGCRDGALAAVGAKTGGAHGNPRVSTWRQGPDGALVEVSASFETYGGPKAVNVSRLVGGPPGWLIVGNRSSGAAAWVSPDAADFALVEGAPELASDGGGITWAFDATAVPGGWLAVGGVLPGGRIDRDPVAWSSADGRSWRRTTLPGTDRYEELQRVVLTGDAVVAVGLRGTAFGAWRRDDDRWVAVGGFAGAVPSRVPSVDALVAADGRLVAAISDGISRAVWTSVDRGGSWRRMELPGPVPAGVDGDVAVVAVGRRLWILVDDGVRPAVWTAEVPADGGVERRGEGPR